MLRRLGDITLSLQAQEAAAKEKIDEAKSDLKTSSAPLLGEMNQIAKSLEAFAVTHKDDLGKLKSRKLQFGVVGWRASSVIRIVKDTLSRIKDVFKASAKTYIRIREEADKDALGRLTDEQLKSIGARRETKDVFFAEPNLPAAVDYGQTGNA